jgi:hypothetical protein
MQPYNFHTYGLALPLLPTGRIGKLGRSFARSRDYDAMGKMLKGRKARDGVGRVCLCVCVCVCVSVYRNILSSLHCHGRIEIHAAFLNFNSHLMDRAFLDFFCSFAACGTLLRLCLHLK